MRVRRAQDRGVQRAGPNAEVIDETPAPNQQRGVFDALDRLAAPGRCDCRHILGHPSRAFLSTSGNAVTDRPGRRYAPVSFLTKKSLYLIHAPAVTADPIRATVRNWLGLTPVWSRKNRVKCACAPKPSRPLIAHRLSFAWTTEFTANSMRSTLR